MIWSQSLQQTTNWCFIINTEFLDWTMICIWPFPWSYNSIYSCRHMYFTQVHVSITHPSHDFSRDGACTRSHIAYWNSPDTIFLQNVPSLSPCEWYIQIDMTKCKTLSVDCLDHQSCSAHEAQCWVVGDTGFHKLCPKQFRTKQLEHSN